MGHYFAEMCPDGKKPEPVIWTTRMPLMKLRPEEYERLKPKLLASLKVKE